MERTPLRGKYLLLWSWSFFPVPPQCPHAQLHPCLPPILPSSSWGWDGKQSQVLGWPQCA